MNRLKTIMMSLGLVLGMSAVAVAPAGAINVFDESCNGGNASTAVCNAENRDDAGKLIRNVVNVLLFGAGVVAVVMIIVGGIKYTTSNGDQARITSGKNTVLYSVIGLIVALMAFAIVNFVVDRFQG